MKLVGRKLERSIINDCLKDNQSHFIAVYGRRRVGKTFMIREHFDNKFDFYVTGLANGNTKSQLANFHFALTKDDSNDRPMPSTWLEAFNRLIQKLEKNNREKIIVFIDELPWMDTPRSGFISGLEYFWNSWASARKNIILIGCGSAASWMINKLINNKTGLYNRVTRRLKLKPFTLHETEAFLKEKKYKIDKYQMVQLFMVFGGIPYYLDMINPSLSVAQNINHLCFDSQAPFADEYRILFKSLFDNADRHLEVVEALLSRRKGLSRKELVKRLSIEDGGGLKRVLEDLEHSDFIRKYSSFGKKKRDTIYQLIDPFVLFHHQHIEAANSQNYWISQINTPKVNAWQGNAYEIVCLLHINQIKKALGISGIQTTESAWWGTDAQIDIVIDRQDRIVNLVEVKFSTSPYQITKQYDQKLQVKLSSFQTQSKTSKTIWITMITTFGLKSNEYAGNVQSILTLEDLFIA